MSGGFIPATELKNNVQKKIQMLFKHEVNCMSWDEQREILYCGELDGSIEMWNMNQLDNEKEENDKLKVKNKEDYKKANQYKNNMTLTGGHSDIITCIISLPKLQFTVSAGLDCKMILWDTIENKIKIEYKGHTRGITSLAYNPSTIQLFSAGFDHWIGVWNPYTDHMVYKIADYRQSLQHIAVIEGSNQLISLDIKGNIKVRDMQKFKEYQNFTLDQDEHGFHFNPVYFTYIKIKSLKLIFCGQSIASYNYDYGFNPNVCDDLKPLCCIMNTRQLKFYTPSGPRIKVWCALTGEVDKIFLDMSHQNAEITAFCQDFYQKRIIIGDKKGYVSSFNCENGAKIMTYPRHSAPLIFIKDCLDLEIVVTVSSDNTINIVSNNYSDEKDSLLRTIKIVEHYITCIDLYVEYSSIVLGFYTGQVGFFDMTSGKFLGQYQDTIHQSYQITDVFSLPDIPFVVASSQNGEIKFISGAPLFYKFQVVERFQNVDQELYNMDKELEDVGVSKVKYCQQNQYLFIGDFKGYLKCYDISKIICNLNENIEYAKRNQKQGVDKHTLYTSMREYFQFNSNTEPDVVWNVKATSDQIIHLEYNRTYKLLFICTSEKNVMIFDSEKGQYIEQLRQNEEIFIQKPIGYRMKNTIDLYDHDLKIRIDRTTEEDEQIEKQKQQEYLNLMKRRIKQQKKLEILSSQTNRTNSQSQSQASSINQSQIDADNFKEVKSISKIAEIKEAIDESDEENNQDNHIFLTNPEKKMKNLESSAVLSSIIQEESMTECDNQEQEEEVQKEKDDRIVYSQYPESEFDAFFYCNLIKKEPYKSMKSKPQWKLELDFKKYYNEYLDKIKEVKQSILDFEKKRKAISIKNQKFKIVRFEVDLSKFDPQKDFQPRITINQKNEIFQAEDDNLDAKVIAANYQKRLQDKLDKKERNQDLIEDNTDVLHQKKQTFNQIWENLSKNKLNQRNQDSEHFLKDIRKNTHRSPEEEEKLLNVYQSLKQIEELQKAEKKAERKRSIIKQSNLNIKVNRKDQEQQSDSNLELKIIEPNNSKLDSSRDMNQVINENKRESIQRQTLKKTEGIIKNEDNLQIKINQNRRTILMKQGQIKIEGIASTECIGKTEQKIKTEGNEQDSLLINNNQNRKLPGIKQGLIKTEGNEQENVQTKMNVNGRQSLFRQEQIKTEGNEQDSVKIKMNEKRRATNLHALQTESLNETKYSDNFRISTKSIKQIQNVTEENLIQKNIKQQLPPLKNEESMINVQRKSILKHLPLPENDDEVKNVQFSFNELLPILPKPKHEDEHSVSSMIEQAFSMENHKQQQLDQMVRRITDKYSFNQYKSIKQ